MSTASKVTIEDLAKLPLDQRITLAQQLWQSIADESQHVPIPEWHRALLRERLAAYRADPSSGITWEELKQRRRDMKR